jgi:hypothetical protein
VDSTVGVTGTVDLLYGRLSDPRHRLVLFDTNRRADLRQLERPGARAALLRLASRPPPYTLEIVSNDADGAATVSIRRTAPGSAAVVTATDLAWPATTVSLGHVAIPFPADDPVYGYLPAATPGAMPSLGALLLRGEAGASAIAVGALTRPRSNPFWPLVAAQLAAVARADLAPRRTAPGPPTSPPTQAAGSAASPEVAAAGYSQRRAGPAVAAAGTPTGERHAADQRLVHRRVE